MNYIKARKENTNSDKGLKLFGRSASIDIYLYNVYFRACLLVLFSNRLSSVVTSITLDIVYWFVEHYALALGRLVSGKLLSYFMKRSDFFCRGKYKIVPLTLYN